MKFSIYGGIEGLRSEDSPCSAFHQGAPSGTCNTDGHYLCDECTQRATCSCGCSCGLRPSQCDCIEQCWKLLELLGLDNLHKVS